MDDLKDTKKAIRAVLIGLPNSTTSIQKFLRSYEEFNYEDLPFRRLGYQSSREMLHSLTDTVTVRGDMVTAKATSTDAHISSLVNNQKISAPKRNSKRPRGSFRDRDRQCTSSQRFGSRPPINHGQGSGSSNATYRPYYRGPSPPINSSASAAAAAAKSSRPPESWTTSSFALSRVDEWATEAVKSSSTSSRPSESMMGSSTVRTARLPESSAATTSSFAYKPSSSSKSSSMDKWSWPPDSSNGSATVKQGWQSESTNSCAKPPNGSASKSLEPPHKSSTAMKPASLLQNILPVPLIKVPGENIYVPAFCAKVESEKYVPRPSSKSPVSVPVAVAAPARKTTTTTIELVPAVNRPSVTSTSTVDEDALSNRVRECHVSDAATSQPNTRRAAAVAEHVLAAAAAAATPARSQETAFKKFQSNCFPPRAFMNISALLQDTTFKICSLVAANLRGLPLSMFNDIFFRSYGSFISPEAFGYPNLGLFLSTLPFITMRNDSVGTTIYPNHGALSMQLYRLEEQQLALALAQSQQFAMGPVMSPVQAHAAVYQGGHVFQAMPSHGVCAPWAVPPQLPPPPGFIMVHHPPPTPPSKSTSNGRFSYGRQHRAPPGYRSNAPVGFASTAEAVAAIIDVNAQHREAQADAHVSPPALAEAVVHEVRLEDAPRGEGEEDGDGGGDIRDAESPFPDSVSQCGNATSNAMSGAPSTNSSRAFYRSRKVNDNMKLNFRRILHKKPEGFLMSDLPEEYRRISGRRLDVSETGFHSVLELVGSIPDVFKMRRTSDTSDWILFSPHIDDRFIDEANFGVVNGVLNGAVGGQIDSPSRVLSALPPLSSRIELSDAVRSNILDVLQLFTNGLVLDQFLSVYQLITDQEFEFDESSGTDMAAIFHAMSDCLSINHTDDGNTVINMLNRGERASRNPKPTRPFARIPLGPHDVVEQSAEFVIESSYKNIFGESYFPVYVENVILPSKFYIRLSDTNAAFEDLMENLKAFYRSPEAKAYEMPRSSAAVGCACVALSHKDGYFCRATIVALDDEPYVKVRYVDFGDTSTLDINYVYLIKKEFMKLPAQAICSQLYACFSANENGYPSSAVRYFRELVESKLLYASICDRKVCRMNEEEERLSLRLLDTSNGDEDIDVQQMLVCKGFAVPMMNRADLKMLPLPFPRPRNMNTETMIPPDSVAVVENGRGHLVNSVSDGMCGAESSQKTTRLLTHTILGHTLHTVSIEDEDYITTFEVSKLLWGDRDILRQQIMLAKMRMSYRFFNETDDPDIFAKLQNLKNDIEVQYNSDDVTARSSNKIVLLLLNKVPEIISVFSKKLSQLEQKERVVAELVQNLIG